MKWRSRLTCVAVLAAVVLVCGSVVAAEAPRQPVRKLIAVEGEGYLETVDGYRVLHVKGTPEQMGRQHGALLKEAIKQNVSFLLGGPKLGPGKVKARRIPRAMIAAVLNAAFADKVPKRFVREMNALAKAAGLPPWKVTAANLIPEMFHCSGFALLKGASAEGKLYHGRVLDYGVDLKLQNHAVLILQQPEGRIPFANVSYAGFIGSVTGMNAKGVSIGEMGGGGVGRWQGIPMSFLVRMVLADAATLEQAVAVFRNNRRTCEYYYVIADARANTAVGMRAVPETIELVKPGEKHRLLPTPVEDAVLLSAGSRYRNLVRLVRAGCGKFTQATAIRLMDAPVAMKSNLHNALMVPGDGVIWVANADSEGRPAWKQKYYRFNIRELMRTRPAGRAASPDPPAATSRGRLARGGPQQSSPTRTDQTVGGGP